MKAARGPSEERWHARPLLGGAVRVLVVLVPVAVAVLSALAIARALPVPAAGVGLVFWWVVVLAGSMAVLWLMDRAARRLLPLAALLELSLLFPGQAPSRARVARSAMRGGFERQLRQAVDIGEDEAPDRAAEVVLGLLAALAHHDRRTRGHSERVHLFTDLIAEELGLGEGDRGRLRWAAMLHDVGKLAVPGHVLNKTTPPDEDEWEVLRRHPQEGARLIAPLKPWLGPWADTVAQHHERHDGTGYPAGLAGDDISLGARIVAVADAYEVMTAARSYRSPVTAAAAREELAACAGTQFHPAVVRAFLNLHLGRLRWWMVPFATLAQLPVVGRVASAARSQAGPVATGTVLAGLTLVGWFPTPTVDPSPRLTERAEAVAQEPAALGEDDIRAGRDEPSQGPAAGEEAASERGLADETPDALQPPLSEGRDRASSRPLAAATPDRILAGSGPGPQVPAEPADRPPSAAAASPGPGPPAPAAPAPTGPGPEPAGPAPAPPPPGPGTPSPAPPVPPDPDPGPTDPAPDPPDPAPGPAPPPPDPDPTPDGPPRTIAVDDFAVTLQDQPVVIDVLANDRLDRGATSFDLIVRPRDGGALVNANRTVTYTPGRAFSGADRFRYKVCGRDPGECSTATVTVEVQAAD